MVWLLWQKPVAQELSTQVKERLITEFALDPPIVEKMRFSGKKGRYSDLKAPFWTPTGLMQFVQGLSDFSISNSPQRPAASSESIPARWH
jgi:hypothetical protein